MPCGFFRQLEYLKEGAIKGDQVFLDKAVPGGKVFIDAELQQRADGIIGVKGKPIAIRDKHEEEVHKELLLIQGAHKPIGEEPVRDKAEPAIDTSDAVGVYHLLFDQGPGPFLGFTALLPHVFGIS